MQGPMHATMSHYPLENHWKIHLIRCTALGKSAALSQVVATLSKSNTLMRDER